MATDLNIIDNLYTYGRASLEEIARILANAEASDTLFEAATDVRKKHIGDRVFLRGIIEFSNHCRRHCHYCGLRAENTSATRYRLSKETILATAREAQKAGYRTIVLQCGEDVHFSPQDIAELTSAIKNLQMAVTLSCGEWSEKEYRLWREAGADRYLMKQETSDAVLFKTLRPGRTLDQRLHAHATLRKLGYQVGSGTMVGLPGQTYETLARDLLLMQETDVDMAGIGPFIPHPQTPLHAYPAGDPLLTCRAVAIARLLMPLAMLPATTALATLHEEGRQLALRAGADVIMPNVSPEDTRKNYEIYPNKRATKGSIAEVYQYHKKLIESEGRYVAEVQGHSPKERFSTLSTL